MSRVLSPYLARVSAARVVSGAHEDVRDKLMSAGSQEHILALVITHNRHCHLKQKITNLKTIPKNMAIAMS